MKLKSKCLSARIFGKLAAQEAAETENALVAQLDQDRVSTLRRNDGFPWQTTYIIEGPGSNSTMHAAPAPHCMTSSMF